MSLDPSLRSLDVHLPASPRALMEVAALMAVDDVSVQSLATVIETDMALAAAVVRTVNSAMFGVLRRVETVAEAVMLLGLRDVAAITFEAGLRDRFPATPLITQLWDAARIRGLLMGRAAKNLKLHAWRAQSAGLFAQVGQAALMAHQPEAYETLGQRLNPMATPTERAAAEQGDFGLDHAVLGSALCRAWGLAADVADYVRDRPLPKERWQTRPPAIKALLCLGAVADACMQAQDPAPVAALYAGPATLDAALVCEEMQTQWRQLSELVEA
ncbi:MAG: hypothetical protein C4K60_08685 [Ideonella sp. MAG2]|nr:MAG: hypothetical protein C4K60_08685 [Ideonella sp. MAG2]